MCIGGSSASTDRKTQLTAEGKENDIGTSLQNIGSKLTSTGGKDTDTGKADIAKSSKYYSDILSGDPTKILAAMAPAINSITGQTDQAKKTLATGGNRTGGSNAGILQLLDKSRGAVMNAIGQAKPAAAAGVESTGKDLATIGLDETGKGLGATTSAASIFGKLADQGMQSRQISQKIHDDAVQQWAEVVSAILFGA